MGFFPFYQASSLVPILFVEKLDCQLFASIYPILYMQVA